MWSWSRSVKTSRRKRGEMERNTNAFQERRQQTSQAREGKQGNEVKDAFAYIINRLPVGTILRYILRGTFRWYFAELSAELSNFLKIIAFKHIKSGSFVQTKMEQAPYMGLRPSNGLGTAYAYKIQRRCAQSLRQPQRSKHWSNSRTRRGWDTSLLRATDRTKITNKNF